MVAKLMVFMSLKRSTTVPRQLAIAYAIIVVAVSSYPGLQLPEIGHTPLDKFAHCAQYAILGFLVCWGWGPWRPGGTAGTKAWIPMLILLIFAGADEYHQHWIPGRVPEWLDWTADATGIIAGYLLGAWNNRRILRRVSNETG